MTDTVANQPSTDTRTLRDKAAVAKDAVADLASEARQYAADQIGVMRDRAGTKAKQVNDTVVDWVQNNPYQALGIAAGTGLLLGILLKRRR